MQCRSAKTLNTRLLVKPLATFGVPLTVVSSQTVRTTTRAFGNALNEYLGA